MAELETVEASCCAPAEQESCCAPEAKGDCCGADHEAGTCGCSAGAESAAGSSEVRERVRDRYAAAARAAGTGDAAAGARRP